MTNWQPVSELTPEIVEAAWRLIVWDGQDEWLCQQWSTLESMDLEVDEDGTWIVYDSTYAEEWQLTHFAVIDAPPEEANT